MCNWIPGSLPEVKLVLKTILYRGIHKKGSRDVVSAVCENPVSMYTK